jgi:hypothetical protein
MNWRPYRRDKDHDQCRSGRQQRVVVKKPLNTWYVSAYIPDKDKTGYYSRRSQSFTSESEAKKFAAAEVSAGIEVSAGTINPVMPKRIVGPTQIRKWLSEKA